jgi:predicted DsbA family dithiol-disulfide isomerase
VGRSWYDVPVLVEVWSDIVCPWCYIGKRRFERAIASFEGREDVEVVWRAFELDPHAPRVQEGSIAALLAAKYGGGLERAQAMMDHVTAEAAAEGLAYRFDIARRGSSFDAHRVAHLAAELGAQEAFVERVMAAYFGEGAAIGEHDVLLRLATEVGLDAARAREVLAGDAYAESVRADEAIAARLGITGVPCFVFDRRTGAMGAQPADVLLRYLREARASGEQAT